MSVIITILVAVAGGILWLAAERPAAYGRFTALFLPLSYYSVCAFGAFAAGAEFGQGIWADPDGKMFVVAGIWISLSIQLAILLAWAIGLHKSPDQIQHDGHHDRE